MPALTAVIFDWAGTIVDFGSNAPMGAFVETFRQFNVDISIEEARQPMGLPKWQHIEALMHNHRIADAWAVAHGRKPTTDDIDAIFQVFTPMNARVVSQHATLIPGAAATVDALRDRGLKIGSTTGYTRDIMEPLLPLAARQGYAPDNLVCAGDLKAGRPSPLMMYRCFADLGVYPPWTVVKVDDTAPGIAEGKAAGSWTVGVAVSGNAMGLTEAQYRELPDEERAFRRDHAHAVLRQSGADVVIDSVADLLPVIDAIELRLAAGERPPAP